MPQGRARGCLTSATGYGGATLRKNQFVNRPNILTTETLVTFSQLDTAFCVGVASRSAPAVKFAYSHRNSARQIVRFHSLTVREAPLVFQKTGASMRSSWVTFLGFVVVGLCAEPALAKKNRKLPEGRGINRSTRSAGLVVVVVGRLSRRQDLRLPRYAQCAPQLEVITPNRKPGFALVLLLSEVFTHRFFVKCGRH